jgi:hypothetical protein
LLASNLNPNAKSQPKYNNMGMQKMVSGGQKP